MNSNRTSSSEQADELALETAFPKLPTDEWGKEHHLHVISLFNHYRHDWMNEIQLLFGYVKLKKYDKLDGLMEKIKIKVQRESLISKLGVPELIVYLFSFQSIVKDLLLEVEMEQEIRLNEIMKDTNSISRLLMGMLEVLKCNAHDSEDEHHVKLQLTADSEFFNADFRYQGAINPSLFRERLRPLLEHYGPQLQWHIQMEDYQAVIEIAVPLNT